MPERSPKETSGPCAGGGETDTTTNSATKPKPETDNVDGTAARGTRSPRHRKSPAAASRPASSVVPERSGRPPRVIVGNVDKANAWMQLERPLDDPHPLVPGDRGWAEDVTPDLLRERDVSDIPVCETAEDYEKEFGSLRWMETAAMVAVWLMLVGGITASIALHRPYVYVGVAGDAVNGTVTYDMGVARYCVNSTCQIYGYTDGFHAGRCNVLTSHVQNRIIMMQSILAAAAILLVCSLVFTVFVCVDIIRTGFLFVAALQAWLGVILYGGSIYVVYTTVSYFFFCDGSFCDAVGVIPCEASISDTFFVYIGAEAAFLIAAVILTAMRIRVHRVQTARLREREAEEDRRLETLEELKAHRENLEQAELERRRKKRAASAMRRQVKLSSKEHECSVVLSENCESQSCSANANGASAAVVHEEAEEEAGLQESELLVVASPIAEDQPPTPPEWRLEDITYYDSHEAETLRRSEFFVENDDGHASALGTSGGWTFDASTGMYASNRADCFWDPSSRQFYNRETRLWSRHDPTTGVALRSQRQLAQWADAEFARSVRLQREYSLDLRRAEVYRDPGRFGATESRTVVLASRSADDAAAMIHARRFAQPLASPDLSAILAESQADPNQLRRSGPNTSVALSTSSHQMLRASQADFRVATQTAPPAPARSPQRRTNFGVRRRASPTQPGPQGDV
jgi:hypothetical protein